MNNSLRHFANQFVAAWRSWMVIWVGSLVAGVFFMIVLLSIEPNSLEWGMFVFLLAVVGWAAAVAGAGSVNSARTDKPAVGLLPGASLAARPNPTIPIHRITRVGAEALAGLAVAGGVPESSSSFLRRLDRPRARSRRCACSARRRGGAADGRSMAAAGSLEVRLRAPRRRGVAGRREWAFTIGLDGVAGSRASRSIGLAVVLFATSDAVARVDGRQAARHREPAHVASPGVRGRRSGNSGATPCSVQSKVAAACSTGPQPGDRRPSCSGS